MVEKKTAVPMMLPELCLQAGRFLGTGILATACHWLLLFLLVEGSLLRPAVASCIGFLLAAALNYGLRRRFVFRSRASHRRTMPRYLTVLTIGFGLNGGIMQFGSGALALPYLAVQIAATGMVFVWNFMAHRLWTFRDDEQGAQGVERGLDGRAPGTLTGEPNVLPGERGDLGEQLVGMSRPRRRRAATAFSRR